jgi:hypothetical protein
LRKFVPALSFLESVSPRPQEFIGLGVATTAILRSRLAWKLEGRNRPVHA